MKRIIFLILLSIVAFSLTGREASAQNGKANVKGEVIGVGEGTLTVESHKGQVYVFQAPEGFDLSTVQVGDWVLVKADVEQDGVWLADFMKAIGNGRGQGVDDDGAPEEADDDQGEGGGNRENNAFCADGKQVAPHPLAPKIAERYGVSETMVMDYYCSGFSIGAIMLAIKTSQLEGVNSDVATLLGSREGGKGWGQIWQEMGLIGSGKEGHSPPGLLKKNGETDLETDD